MKPWVGVCFLASLSACGKDDEECYKQLKGTYEIRSVETSGDCPPMDENGTVVFSGKSGSQPVSTDNCDYSAAVWRGCEISYRGQCSSDYEYYDEVTGEIEVIYIDTRQTVTMDVEGEGESLSGRYDIKMTFDDGTDVGSCASTYHMTGVRQ